MACDAVVFEILIARPARWLPIRRLPSLSCNLLFSMLPRIINRACSAKESDSSVA
jgi:hypothetical protein